MRKEKTKKKLLDWMMSEEYSKLKKKLNIEKHEIIGGLDLPEGRELKEEVTENSQKLLHSNNGIGGAPTNYRRRRADQQKSAAAPTNCRRRRGAAGPRLYSGALLIPV